MRMIDADKLMEKIKEPCKDCTQMDCGCFLCDQCEITEEAERIEEAPTVDAEPVRHGHWDKHYHEEEDFAEWWAKCSECGYTEAVFARGHICSNWNYCPRCGAKMDATQSNDSNALDALKAERREE